uniref:Uncharacterized protein n=1 Tax=Oryza brachyantha TaxID=4533 RepID=J3KYZ9_ORYBR
MIICGNNPVNSHANAPLFEKKGNYFLTYHGCTIWTIDVSNMSEYSKHDNIAIFLPLPFLVKVTTFIYRNYV